VTARQPLANFRRLPGGRRSPGRAWLRATLLCASLLAVAALCLGASVLILDGPLDMGAHAAKSGRGGSSSGDSGGGTGGGTSGGGGDDGGDDDGSDDGGDDGGDDRGDDDGGGDDGGGASGGAGGSSGGGSTSGGGKSGTKDPGTSRGRSSGTTRDSSDDDGDDDGGDNDGGEDDGGGDDGDDGGGDDNGGSSSGGSSSGGSSSGGSSSGGSSSGGSSSGGSSSSGVSSAGGTAAGGNAASRKGSIGIDREGGREGVAGEIVLLDDRPELLDQARRMGFRLKDQHQFDGLGLVVTRLVIPQGMSLSLALAQVRHAFPDALVDVNGVYRSASVGTTLDAGHPAQVMGWSQAPGDCGHGVGVGLIDGDIDPGPLVGGRVHERSFLASGEESVGSNHGTTVAAILVGAPDTRLPGLVPGAELYSAEVFSADGDGRPVTTALRIVAALDWLTARGVRVANLSLAGEDNLLLKAAVRKAAERGLVLVAAAGNGGPQAQPSYPAAYDRVIAVTAVDASLLPLPQASRGAYVDFAAPGDGIPAAESLAATVSGTSFAAPFVTALVAARLGAGVAIPDDGAAVRLLAAAALDLGEPGRDDVFGWGFVQGQAACAVRSARMHAPAME